MDVEDKEAAKLQRFVIVDGHVDTVGGGDTSVAMTTYGEDQGGGTNTDYGDKLQNLRSCYVCKINVRNLHLFYDQLCSHD